MTLKKAEPGQTRIGWIGAGVMGRWMCQHLLSKGYKAAVYNRTKDKAAPLLEAGASWAETPRAVAERSDVVFAIVGFPKDVREVFLGASGALAGSKPGTILVDMTTSEPSLAVEIHQAAKAKGVETLDAPVSGGDVGAKNAALSIMIGGDRAVVDAVAPLFECMGKTIVHQGGPGSGQHTKMVNQVLIAANMIAVCEGLLYGYKAGLNLETVFKSVSVGAAGSKAPLSRLRSVLVKAATLPSWTTSRLRTTLSRTSQADSLPWRTTTLAASLLILNVPIPEKRSG